MARLPEAVYRTTPVGPRQEARATYNGEGQGLMDLGQGIMGVSDKLLQIEKDKRTREETINAVRSINDFNMKAQQEWVRVTSEEDISSTESVRKYHMFLQEQAAKTLSEFPGGEESRGRLAVQLEQDRGNHALSSYNQGVALQKKVVGEYAEGVIGRISAQAALAPSDIDAHFAALDKELGALSPALTPEQESAYYRMGRSQVVVRSATAYMDVNNFEGANAVLSAKGITEVIDPDTLRQLRSRMTLGALAQRKQKETLSSQIAEMESVLGRPLTEPELLRKMNIEPSSSSKQSLVEWVAEVESVTGKPVTSDMILKKAGAIGAGDKESNALTEMAEMSDAIESGIATERDVKSFKNNWSILTKPHKWTDEEGRVHTVTLAMPDYLRRAGATLGLGEDKDVAQVVRDIPDDVDIPYEDTFVGMNARGTLTGPEAVIPEKLGTFPGAIFGGGGEHTSNQSYVRQESARLGQVFALNPRFPVGEMEDIQRRLALTPAMFDNREHYHQELMGLRRHLVELSNQAARMSVDGADAETRSHAKNVFNGITAFLPKLGNFPTVKSREELDKLMQEGKIRPGEPFYTPDGSVKKAPGGR